MENGDTIAINKKIIIVTIEISATNPITTKETRKIKQVKLGTQGKGFKNNTIAGIFTFHSGKI